MFLTGLWLIVTLELRQRVRGVSWYVLLGVFMLLVGIVTFLLWLATSAWLSGGGGVFSTIIFFVLLLGTLVSPALSGNAVNGDREAGTLATTQVTLISTGQLVLGKFLAAWITALAFLAAALPFLIFAVVLGEVSLATIAVSVLVLAAELGVIAAVGVGLSGILTRPLFSIVLTYLVVAALSLGTLIAFALLGTATQQQATSVNYYVVSSTFDEATGRQSDIVCSTAETTTFDVARFDYYWWILAANPYVVVADAAPGTFNDDGYPTDLFGQIAVGVRSAQAPPELFTESNGCEEAAQSSFNDGRYTDGSFSDGGMYSGQTYGTGPTSQEIYDGAVPSWFIGLTMHLLLGAGALTWAWRRTRTPALHLSAGSRIA
ncbi:ABC transporter permease [Cryobacterium sp. TMT1-3]|uniref:ABC transporter permease n=1 Tax=Cryobacterium luteum TaxID=1424661 RepID=A0A5F0D7C5_9MICO|nr:ABC transporter permease [Cryobacterium luteum]TFC28258.1 ABC transporter permease [Cryobacterium sp. TMT1-3]